jgi:hypothetical protein
VAQLENLINKSVQMVIENKMNRHKSLVCETCSQFFTRKSSASRHNRNIHSGKGNIVRVLDHVVAIDGMSKNKIRDHKLLVCATCSQDFTRKSSASRHNRNIHHGFGIIVSFIDYIVGRIEGRYVAANPLLFRKNSGNNIAKAGSNFARSTHTPPLISYGDEPVRKEDNEISAEQRHSMQAKDDSLDYAINLISRVQKIEKLLSVHQSQGNAMAIPCMGINDPYGLIINHLAQQFDMDYFFGWRGEACPCCAYFAIYRLDFKGGSIHSRIWSTDHRCDARTSALCEKESVSTRYVNACDSMPIYLIPIVNDWLKSSLNIFAIKLPQLFDIDKGLIEVIHPKDASRSVCVSFSKEDISTRFTDNQNYWARVVHNENNPTPISGEELSNFLYTVRGSTFGIIEICSRGWRIEYYLIYLGRAAASVRVHTDVRT